MTSMVHCARLKREAPGLDFAPWPGELGRRIYAEVSQQAWQEWLAHQTMLINENRLSPMDPAARRFLVEQMQQFLFGEGAERPPGFVAPDAADSGGV